MNRKDAYWLGYRSGRNLAAYEREHGSRENHERRMKEDLLFTMEKHRAYAVGELRGYREHRPC